MTEIARKMRSECHHCKHRREVAGNAHIQCVKPDANMTGDQHGIRSGWFMYPLLFDPSWKTKQCSNYETAESVNRTVSQSVSVAE